VGNGNTAPQILNFSITQKHKAIITPQQHQPLEKMPHYLFIGVAQLVEALRYKPEGRGFDSRWCHWNFLLT